MTDRRVRILRFYLLLAALAVATVFRPELAWLWLCTPFALIPCPTCCPSECIGVCNSGYNAPDEVTLELSGITGSPCSTAVTCPDLDGTYVLGNFSDIGSCHWSLIDSFCGSGSFSSVQYLVSLISRLGNTEVLVRLAFTGGAFQDWRSAAFGATPVDCAASLLPGPVSCAPFAGATPCTIAGSTADVTF